MALALAPFIIARKNFVLIESDNGANASAMIFSIAETAKANNLLPWSKQVQEKCTSRYKKT
ncbi:MAG: hypothetical protein IJR29_09095 [Butyrivibrio sp.]|nr:hypothetical protein [Butyrivibrio sp.]